MKLKVFTFVLIAALLIVGSFFINSATAHNYNILTAQPQVQITSLVQSVKVTSFEVVDASAVHPGMQKVILKLHNDSDKDVYFVDLLLSADKYNRSGFGFYTKEGTALLAHGDVTLQRVIAIKGPLTPQLRCVVFVGMTGEGDKSVTKSITVKWSQATQVAKKYFDKLTALDTADKPLDAIAQLRREISSEIAAIEESDPSGTGPIDTRMANEFHKGALMDVLDQLAEAEKAWVDSNGKAENFGARAAKNITRTL